MWFESLLVFILFKFKKRPNISRNSGCNKQNMSTALIKPGGWTNHTLRSLVLELVFLSQWDKKGIQAFPYKV